jgi:hypothetical protein
MRQSEWGLAPGEWLSGSKGHRNSLFIVDARGERLAGAVNLCIAPLIIDNVDNIIAQSAPLFK